MVPTQALDDQLPSAAFHLLMFLFSRCGQDDCVRIGYEQMMKGIGASRQTVATGLAVLSGRGWLFVGQSGGSKRTAYMLQIPNRRLGMDLPPSRAKAAVD